MIDNDLDTDDHGALPAVSGALVDRPGSSDGSRSPANNVRPSPYSIKDGKNPSTDHEVPRSGLTQEDRERLANTVVEQTQRLMSHLEGRIQSDRAQIQQEQGLANQTSAEQLIIMQQESNDIRTEGLIPRQDLLQAFASLNEQQKFFRSEIDHLRQNNHLSKQEENDVPMADAPSHTRGNLLRREYRSYVYPQVRSTTIPPVRSEYAAYTQPGGVSAVNRAGEPPPINPYNQGSAVFDDNRVPETPYMHNDGQSPSILPDTPVFVGNSQARSTASWQLHKLPPPPKFEIKQSEGWLREVRFWRELYRRIDGDQVLACLGLNSSEEVKDILMDFLDENPAAAGNRTFEGALVKIQKEFGAVNDLVRTEKLHQIMSFKKKADWDVRKFRRRFKSLRLMGIQTGADLDEIILFTQLITALNLTVVQRHMVLSIFENSQSTKNVSNLQSITVRLFGHYSPDTVSTFLEGKCSSDSDRSIDEDHALLAAKSSKKNTNLEWKPQQCVGILKMRL